MIEAFKLSSGFYDTALPSLLEIHKDIRTRGHSKMLYQHRSNKDIRKNFVTKRIINQGRVQGGHPARANPHPLKLEKI